MVLAALRSRDGALVATQKGTAARSFSLGRVRPVFLETWGKIENIISSSTVQNGLCKGGCAKEAVIADFLAERSIGVFPD